MTALEPELLQYARFLGVEAAVARFPQLGLLLGEGLAAAVPAGWRVVHSDGDAEEVFFLHEATGLVLHEHPADKTVRHRIRFATAALQAAAAAAAQGGEPASTTPAALEEEAVTVPGEEAVEGAVEGAVGDEEEAGDTGSDGEFEAALERLQPATLVPQRDEFDDLLEEAGARSVPPLVPQRPPPPPPPPPPPVAVARVVPLVPVLPAPAAGGGPTELTTRDRLSMMEARAGSAGREREPEVPDEFLCPITAEVMRDPVVTADGFTYERCVIARWLETHDTSPCSNAVLPYKHLAPNLALRGQITAYVDQHPHLLAVKPVTADDYQSSDTE